MMMAQHQRSLFSEALLQSLHSVATGLMNKLEMPPHAAKRLYLAGRWAFPKNRNAGGSARRAATMAAPASSIVDEAPQSHDECTRASYRQLRCCRMIQGAADLPDESGAVSRVPAAGSSAWGCFRYFANVAIAVVVAEAAYAIARDQLHDLDRYSVRLAAASLPVV
jgi:hypothetical protein